jgi:uncharacterized membrane protein
MEQSWVRIAFAIGIAFIAFSMWLMRYASARSKDLNVKKHMILRILGAFCAALGAVLISYRHVLSNLERLPGGRFTVSIPIFLLVLFAFPRKPV